MELMDVSETEITPTSGFCDAIHKILSHSGVPQPKKLKREEEEENRSSRNVADVTLSSKGESGPVESDKPALTSSSSKCGPVSRSRRKTKRELEPWHVLPDVTDRERDRKLAKIATKGVVQLFNAVRAQQNVLEEKLEEAGPSMRKTEQALKTVSKSSFLHLLRNPHGAPEDKVQQAKGDDTAQRWQVLEDDYMLKGTQPSASESSPRNSDSENDEIL